MATLLLTAVGTAIGGPLGGALGALVGQRADNAIFGSGSTEGPRLKELSVTTSSYGQPIARHFGRARVAGSVIWATDLVESSSTEGGKGRPTTTTYSYSASFAVALSSTPIDRLGRIWADGTLLRGAAGDLKVQGFLRTYLGNGDAPVDPLIAADKGSETPAFRDCAYVVFEDLELADFGNRIPALSFEIFGADDSSVSIHKLVPGAIETSNGDALTHIKGLSDEGGPLAAVLSIIDRVVPLDCTTTAKGVTIATRALRTERIALLPEKLKSADSPNERERPRSRVEALNKTPLALRYYDEDRDYQPGVQRAIGRRPNGRETLIELPATLTAEGAKNLANGNANRARWANEKQLWRTSELNPQIMPGDLVRVPDIHGVWRVTSWEWLDRGVELSLQRIPGSEASQSGGDTGAVTPPNDLQVGSTELRIFEAPALFGTDPSSSRIYAAASSATRAWRGASLLLEQGDTLVPIGSTGPLRSTIGALTSPLLSSPSLLFEPRASMDVATVADDFIFADTDMIGLTNGKNRMLVGGEVIQFQSAEALGNRNWRLHGLLRGRAGTEDFAASGHPIGTPIVQLDEGPIELLHSNVQSSPNLRIAAIGRGDHGAVFASLSNAGLSRRPPSPVHARACLRSDLTIELYWTRRARGHWLWDYENDVPLVEEVEKYVVGYGPLDSPFEIYPVDEPRIAFSDVERDALVSEYGASDLWVYQVGTYSRSSALLLTHFS